MCKPIDPKPNKVNIKKGETPGKMTNSFSNIHYIPLTTLSRTPYLSVEVSFAGNLLALPNTRAPMASARNYK